MFFLVFSILLYNKFYLKFDDFRKEVIDFLENEIWKEEGFDKILSDKFQIIKPDFSGSYV
ncbi:MAG: hypothetical protein L3J34_09480 [Flavobacteriaceae bacterium]|nr:hypothetical protein [Flavobacteriaceae bacterium]